VIIAPCALKQFALIARPIVHAARAQHRVNGGDFICFKDGPGGERGWGLARFILHDLICKLQILKT